MSTYVINRLIYFDNEAFVLYAAAAPEEVLRIGAIASRCLDQLLQANGQIVSKRDLMSGAWGAFGLEVTDNSLAQVVRQLRVALEKLQPNHELIVTIPRIGYKISEQVELLDETATPALPLVPAAPMESEPQPATQLHTPTPLREHRHEQSMDLLLGFAAIACWVALFQLPGLLRAPTLPERPFVEHQAESIDGIRVHLEDMPGGALQPDNRQLVAEVKKLAPVLDLGTQDLHIYRFADRYRSLDLLCQGQLLAPDSQCLGVQPDE
ncbi:winged helix-turn-helix domain-containing protein [Aquipseudomonas campi]|uniref:Winged helix-turn-helix domain-containing protein n=1 Tax=Aquipseudomonas campi TaxID=2731681 RepID=A0A6M8FD18_9GAMM|nr:winged helix-turn-helix domain-containing protein [Pseudomonas campi]QKE62797.1 winged helix-turn-helix domain-containing protein [Pseudomonas campi]